MARAETVEAHFPKVHFPKLAKGHVHTIHDPQLGSCGHPAWLDRIRLHYGMQVKCEIKRLESYSCKILSVNIPHNLKVQAIMREFALVPSKKINGFRLSPFRKRTLTGASHIVP